MAQRGGTGRARGEDEGMVDEGDALRMGQLARCGCIQGEVECPEAVQLWQTVGAAWADESATLLSGDEGTRRVAYGRYREALNVYQGHREKNGLG